MRGHLLSSHQRLATRTPSCRHCDATAAVGVTHMGDKLAGGVGGTGGDADDETILLDLSRIPDDIEVIAIAVNIYTDPGSFDMVRCAGGPSPPSPTALQIPAKGRLIRLTGDGCCRAAACRMAVGGHQL